MFRTIAPHRFRAGFVVVLLAVATVVVVAWSHPAAAADGPTFTGGQVAAPYGSEAQPTTNAPVASNGTKALVVWAEKEGGIYGIYGRITSADTTTIGSRITIFQGTKDSLYPDVAWNGSNWLVVWQYYYSSTDPDIRGSVVSTSGTAGAFILVEGNTSFQSNPAVTAGPNGEWFVVWEDQRDAATTLTDIYGRPVTSAGAVVTNYPFYRLSYDLNGIQTSDFNPDIVWWDHYGIYQVVYDAQGIGRSRIREMQFNPEIKYPGEPIVDYPSSIRKVSNPSIALGNNEAFIAYEDDTMGSTGVDIAAVVMIGDNPNDANFVVSNRNGNEGAPSVAYNGEFLVAWTDRRNDSGGDIYGAHVKDDLTLVDTNGFLITNFTPKDQYPSLSTGTTKKGTFTASWLATPSGQGTGVIAYGIDHPAPK